jgi:hypothetical protein
VESELTLGDIYEAIAERLALARTKALMGERLEALGIFQGASLDFTRFHEVLSDYPGFHALEHAFNVTMAALCEDRMPSSGGSERGIQTIRASRQRRKTRKAA